MIVHKYEKNNSEKVTNIRWIRTTQDKNKIL